MTDLQPILQQPEALPTETSCPVALDCQETVFLSAYDSAPKFPIGRRSVYGQHSRTDQLGPVPPDLIEFGFESDLIRFDECSFHYADSDAGPAVRSAEPGNS